MTHNDVIATIQARASACGSPIGRGGFELPLPSDLAHVVKFPLSEADAALLHQGNVHVTGDPALDSFIVIDARPSTAHSYRTNVHFGGKGGHIAYLAGCKFLSASIIMEGENQWIYVGTTAHALHFPGIAVRGEECGVYIGKNSSSHGARVGTMGKRNFIAIGEDCMIAHGVEFSSSDNHSLIDITSESVLNPPQSIVIYPHVWVGAGSMILKGVNVGCGSTIGAHSLVNKHVPHLCVTSGNPAIIRRTNCTWSRHHEETTQGIQHEISRIQGYIKNCEPSL